MLSSRTRCRGFTLTETLVTLAIVVVMAAVAALGFRNQRPIYLFDRHVRTLHDDLCAARMRAIGGNCRVTVAFDGTNTSYSIWTDSDSDGSRGEGETLVQRMDPALGIRISAVPSTGSFTPSGRFDAAQHACNVGLVSSRGKRADLTILQSGLVKMGRTGPTEDSPR